MDDETRALLREALDTYKRYVEVLEARQRDASGWVKYYVPLIIGLVIFLLMYAGVVK